MAPLDTLVRPRFPLLGCTTITALPNEELNAGLGLDSELANESLICSSAANVESSFAAKSIPDTRRLRFDWHNRLEPQCLSWCRIDVTFY